MRNKWNSILKIIIIVLFIVLMCSWRNTCIKQIKDLEDEAHLMDNKVVNLQYKYDKLNEEYMEYKERMKAYE